MHQAPRVTVVKCLQANYGIDKPECISEVKEIYDQLGMRQVFEKYENDSQDRIAELIHKVSGDLPESIFFDFFHKIFKRKK